MMTIISGGLIATGVYLHISEELPKVSSLKDYRPPLATMVYSDDNRKIAEFYKERRFVIPLSKMPKILIQAFIAAEDSRFFTHRGVDYLGIIRAFFKNIEAGTIVQGGSTITQQVVKPFLSASGRSYKRKLKEALLAYRIEKTFTKEDILFLYLNQIYLGYGAYGVEAAAENYFGKSAKDMNLAECAILAGLPKAPSEYSPFKEMEKAKARQRYVLRQMVIKGYITDAQAGEAMKTDIHIKPRRNWYMETVPCYSEHIRRYIEDKFGPEILYTGGLKIYTTVNIEMQKAALAEVENGLKSLEKRQRYTGKTKPQATLVCIESETGHVKVMAGGRDFKKSQLNRVAQSRRQPGSAFKPIIYAAALDKGYTPVSMINDSDVTYWNKETKKAWRPSNYDKKYYGPIRLRRALALSRNIPAVKLLNAVGIDYARNYARKLGITSDLNKGLSLALGASGVSLLELVTAYSVFTNLGDLVPPVFIRKIIDRDGNEIQEPNLRTEKVIEASTAYIMTNLLESVVKRGTGRRALALGRPAAGKTGTSSNLHDAWFVGYTPQYITGTWVGFDMEQSLGNKETGSKAALPIWLSFMKKIHINKPVMDFQVPKTVVFARSECFKERAVPAWYVKRKPDAVAGSDLAGSDFIARPKRLTSGQNRTSPPTIIGLEQFFKSTM
ncbi:penicillin-binding protein 1A [Desulfonema magnum]|nr:PBP1A family penicillin-binding protein [Desulfonema magnum]